MPGRPSERRAERAGSDTERGASGRAFTRGQAAVAAVVLASLLWLIARLEVSPRPAPAAAPETAEAPP